MDPIDLKQNKPAEISVNLPTLLAAQLSHETQQYSSTDGMHKAAAPL